MDIYLGDDRGAVIGPYGDSEIQPRLRGEEWLSSQGAGEVYAVRARDIEDARARIASEVRRARKT